MPQPAFKAVVWDMDGLLLDTERISLVAWHEGAAALGLSLSEDLFRDLIGRNGAGIRARLLELLGPEVDGPELFRLASLSYRRLLENGPPLKPGAKQCLQLLRQLRVPQAVATSTSRPLAETKLAHHGLLELLDALVTGDQVARGKPEPEPYLLAAQRLGVPPQLCLAFEDSVAGIQSAHAAGLYTILVPDLALHDAHSLARVRQTLPTLHQALPLLRHHFTPQP